LPGAAQIVLAGVVHPIWGKQLVLVYKSESGVIPSIGTWHRVLVDRVATFKIPQRYVAIQDLGLDEFPRKENGKLDRRTIETLLIQHQSATD
jgi:acyl-CoA synthetase (AMP-forming)/AMP-acid ligase II